ncbi:MAG TPA: polymer-forming cytoskeletal protein [Pyrinomonadaceae bacterium]|nr:polymer-forming cytoskeletal protein [Pyrinomonadaceae bacterium]
MFRTDRNSSVNQANSEPAYNPATQPSSTHHASAHEAGAHSQAASSARAVSESEALARDIKEGVLNGFVGNGTILTGEANFRGMLRVDGRLTGHVKSEDGTLIVSSNGQIEANIEVAVAQIYGTVIGDIIATKRIEMGRVAKVTGNIQTPALVIDQGAVFEGSCRMPQPKKAEDQRREDERSAGAQASTEADAGKSPDPKISWSAIISENGELKGAPQRKNNHVSQKPVNA